MNKQVTTIFAIVLMIIATTVPTHAADRMVKAKCTAESYTPALKKCLYGIHEELNQERTVYKDEPYKNKKTQQGESIWVEHIVPQSWYYKAFDAKKCKFNKDCKLAISDMLALYPSLETENRKRSNKPYCFTEDNENGCYRLDSDELRSLVSRVYLYMHEAYYNDKAEEDEQAIFPHEIEIATEVAKGKKPVKRECARVARIIDLQTSERKGKKDLACKIWSACKIRSCP